MLPIIWAPPSLERSDPPVAAYIFIPIYIGVRTMMERISINADLQYISIMSPQKIIWGKVLSSVYLIVLFYSAAVPFLVFSYLLRGIDLPTILLAVALTFTLNVLLTMGAIVIALAPLHTVMKILAALFVGGNAIFTSIWIVGEPWPVRLLPEDYHQQIFGRNLSPSWLPI